jgi:hypothetical protein
VLDELVKLNSPSSVVALVISEANDYFNKLRSTNDSAIKAMQIPGLLRAANRQSARQRRDIDEKSVASSPLFGLFHQSYLLYGSEGFRYSRDGEVQELAKMQAMSAEVELPRMLMIDPEGNALRRREAIDATRALSTRVSEAKRRDT